MGHDSNEMDVIINNESNLNQEFNEMNAIMNHDSSGDDDVRRSLEINYGMVQEHAPNNILAPPVMVVRNNAYEHDFTHHSKSSSSSLEKDLETGLDVRSS